MTPDHGHQNGQRLGSLVEEDHHFKMSERSTSRQWPADMPGVTTAWLALANGVSERTIRWRRTMYKTPPEDMPAIDADIALDMARGRPKGAHIGLWTRLAMKERVAAGLTYRAVAAEFSVSVASVQRAVHRGGRGFQPLSFERVRSASQSQNLKNFQECERA